MRYRSRRERAEGRVKLMGILAAAAVIGLLVWFWSLGGAEEVTTITEPVASTQQAG